MQEVNYKRVSAANTLKLDSCLAVVIPYKSCEEKLINIVYIAKILCVITGALVYARSKVWWYLGCKF